MRVALGASGTKRVLRGGSWINNGRNCRSANRNGNTPGNRNHNIGFRLARAQDTAGWLFLTQPKARPMTCLRHWQRDLQGRYVSSNQAWKANAYRLSFMMAESEFGAPGRTHRRSTGMPSPQDAPHVMRPAPLGRRECSERPAPLGSPHGMRPRKRRRKRQRSTGMPSPQDAPHVMRPAPLGRRECSERPAPPGSPHGMRPRNCGDDRSSQGVKAVSPMLTPWLIPWSCIAQAQLRGATPRSRAHA